MKKIILLISLFVTVNCLSSSKEEFIGFDIPLRFEKIKLGKSETSNEYIELSCWVYKTFAVAQINDPGSMGATDIEIRHIDTSKSTKQICAETNIGSNIRLKNFYGYYVGSRGGFLFIDEPDSFGNQQVFQVFLKDGKEILHETRDSTRPLLFKTAKTVSITFYKGLDVKCPLGIEGLKCWKKVVADNKIPTSLKLQMPDCRLSFQKENSSLNNSALVSAKVEFKDLNHPVIKYMGGKAICTPAP
jgi:hypothetical protein